MSIEIGQTKIFPFFVALALFFSVAFSLVFLSVMSAHATASEQDDHLTTSNVGKEPNVEEIFRLGLDTLLKMPRKDGLNASLRMTGVQQASVQADETRITMFRLYNKWTGEHFFTSNETEKSNLIKGGWSDEGVGWYAPKTSNTKVYRLYNPFVSGGDHHYTTNVTEYNNLGSQGWKKEGIGWYSVNATDTTDRVPLYRQYNPFAQTGTHNYTMDKKENDYLVKNKWKEEGIAWYGYSRKTPSVKQLDFSKIKVTTTPKTYTSKAQTQTITSSAYKLNTDYTVVYSNNKNAGTAKITIKGTGKYAGSKTYQFTIKKAPLTVKWSNVALTYNSKSQTPTATLSGVLGADRVTPTVSGAKTSAGEGYVATAKINNSNYQLTNSTTKFSIVKAPLTLAWDEQTVFTYNTKAQKPEAKITSGILGNDKVTLIVSGEQTNASDTPYTATVSIDNNNYQLPDDTTKAFLIKQLDISNASVTLGNSLTYNATRQTQTVSKVTVGDIALTEGIDYSVSGNIGSVAGRYITLMVKGTTNCTGSIKNIEFEIKKAPLSVIWKNTELTYNAEEQKPIATVNGAQGKDTITLSVSGEQTMPSETDNPYVATATIDAKSQKNYEITSNATTNFTIGKAPLSVIWTNTSLIYNKEKQKPSATVNGTLGTDTITVTVSGEQINPSETDNPYVATVSIDETSQKNYEITSNATTNFTIGKAPLTLEWSNTTFTYDETMHLPDAVVKSGILESDSVTVYIEGEQENANKAGETYTATASLDPTSDKYYEITTATKTQSFTIAQATPVYAPTGVIGSYGKTLSTVALPSPASSETPASSIQWSNTSTVMNERGQKKFKVTFTPLDSTNFKTLTDLEVSVEVIGFEATFNASPPASGYTITIDDKSTDSVAMPLAFDDNAAALPVHTHEASDFPTVKVTSSNLDSYYFAGWATTSGATTGTKVYEMLGTTVSADTQYYAVWATAKGFWLGTAGADATYVDEDYFATNDVNYHSGAEIVTDMDILHNAGDRTYAAVKSKWDKYFENADSTTAGKDNQIRLYATYEGGESESCRLRGASPLNKYFEFRILEVSGADGHPFSGVGATGNDESVVTFMATHTFPTAYSMNATKANGGGWGYSQLFKDLNHTGAGDGNLYKKFSIDFRSVIKEVTKEYNNANLTTQTSTPSLIKSQFWIISYSELVDANASDYRPTAPKYEGTQYAWCKSNVLNALDKENVCLTYHTRSGDTPASCYMTSCRFWQRSPYIGNKTIFICVDEEGDPGRFTYANKNIGIVPAFCF